MMQFQILTGGSGNSPFLSVLEEDSFTKPTIRRCPWKYHYFVLKQIEAVINLLVLNHVGMITSPYIP